MMAGRNRKSNKIHCRHSASDVTKMQQQQQQQSKCSSSITCFFCVMKEQDPTKRSAGIAKCFKEMAQSEDQEQVLVLSGLWNIAMTHSNDPEFPMLGIFNCMAALITRGLHDIEWLNRDQNIYIPYYAAHIIGSYTMHVESFAEEAVKAGVVPPLLELLRGKMSWVEQRVAVRALGHLASYERTFPAVAEVEEIVELAMNLASTCFDLVYTQFIIGSKQRAKRYHCDLLTRGMGGCEMENRKAEEWASQLQCWSLHLLSCFAYKHKYIDLMCRGEFLKKLCKMWGGLVNDNSPAGVGLLRILCYSRTGRIAVAESKQVVETLCNLSRSSDDWQYMGIDCLLLLIQDPHTRSKLLLVEKKAASVAFVLADLAELKSLGGRTRVGEAITGALLLLLSKKEQKESRVLKELLESEVKQEKAAMSKQESKATSVLAASKKQQGNERFWSGDVEGAGVMYSEALQVCPLKLRKERVVLYSNRAQCHLLLFDPDSAISDATRALCLSDPVNSHGKSLWRRSQAYDMKGMGKESLMDCILFVNGWLMSQERKHVRIPYYAARMINKQMNNTWLFRDAHSRYQHQGPKEVQKEEEEEEKSNTENGSEWETADENDETLEYSNPHRTKSNVKKNQSKKPSMSGAPTSKPSHFIGLPTIREEWSCERRKKP